MLIRCKQLRDGGSTITLGKGKDSRDYQFAPLKNAPDDHVADVTRQDDIATLLAIPEGFEIHAGELKSGKATAPAPVVPTAAASSASVDYTTLEKVELLNLVEQRTGARPHPSTGVKKLVATLVDLDATK